MQCSNAKKVFNWEFDVRLPGKGLREERGQDVETTYEWTVLCIATCGS